jgi:flavin reductase (DIM6/NTAB) family NADH-FMN oxidoreductase RutF
LTDVTVTLEPATFRALLRRHAAGVVVVTVAHERPVGFTATSFTSVSLDPPLVSFCLDRGSSSWPALETATHVGVHVLTETQEAIARRFATSGVDRFAPPISWRRGGVDVPVLDGALAVLICRVAERVHAGDHVIVLGSPVAGESGPGNPLVYHDGRYRRAT